MRPWGEVHSATSYKDKSLNHPVVKLTPLPGPINQLNPYCPYDTLLLDISETSTTDPLTRTHNAVALSVHTYLRAKGEIYNCPTVLGLTWLVVRT